MQTTITIRNTETADIPRVLEIYNLARAFMRRTGNLHQWSDGYPSQASLEADIAEGNSYVIVRGDGVIVATFYFRKGVEPTYLRIYDGEWPNDEAYGVIHRAASDGSVKGVMDIILDYCFRHCRNIRIDTHSDNKTMQNALARNAFTPCGTILLASGAPRLAYHKKSDSRP